jgi:type II secretory pathway component PulM
MNRPEQISQPLFGLPASLRQTFRQRLQPLHAWWQARQARERRALRWGAFVLLPLLVIFGLWLPLSERVRKIEAQVVQARAQTAEMRGMRDAWGGKGKATARAALPLDLAPRIEAELRSGVPGFKGSVRAGDEGVEVLLEAVAFDALLPWLALLGRRDGLFPREVQLQPVASGASSGAGLVGGRIRLQAAGQ